MICSTAIATNVKYKIDVEIKTNPEKFKIFPDIGNWNIAYLDAGGGTVFQVNKNVKSKNSLPRALAIDRAYFKKNPEGGHDILVIDGPTIDEQSMPK